MEEDHVLVGLRIHVELPVGRPLPAPQSLDNRRAGARAVRRHPFIQPFHPVGMPRPDLAVDFHYFLFVNGKWEEELTLLGDGLVDFKKYFALLKENNIHVPFSLHCEYLTDKDDLRTKTAKMKKDLTTLRGWLREAEL